MVIHTRFADADAVSKTPVVRRTVTWLGIFVFALGCVVLNKKRPIATGDIGSADYLKGTTRKELQWGFFVLTFFDQLSSMKKVYIGRPICTKIVYFAICFPLL